MATTTTTKPARKSRKPVRTIAWVSRAERFNTGVVRITVDREECLYLVTEIIADDCRCFELVGPGQDQRYTVALAITGERTCNCKGHRSHGHCKHADGMAALLATDQLESN
jgi:hypothetical protein